MKPTDRPWYFDGQREIRIEGTCRAICEVYDFEKDDGKTRNANAALIVQAVNSHEKMRDALTWIINTCTYAAEHENVRDPIIRAARAALRLAGGERC